MASYLRSTRPDGMSRRVRAALASHDHAHSYHVIDADGESHGDFPTIGEARGCVAFDGLTEYAITYGDWNVVEQVTA